MVKSDWGVVLTLVGCLGLAALGLADVKSQPKPPIYCDKGANGANCRPQQYVTERSGIPGFFEGSISNPEPKTGVDHEKRDLAAQEASAVFAFWMVIIAACSAVVTLIGTFLLFRQIVLTRKAVEETGLATEAMREANKIAHESAERQLRAYISVEPLGIQGFDRQHVPYGFVRLTNRGQTPANEICIHAWYSIERGDVGEDFDPTQERKIIIKHFVSQRSLGPGDTLDMSYAIRDTEITSNDSFKRGHASLVQFGAISYSDIFGHRRETYFSFYYAYGLLVAEHAGKCRLGNYMT